MEYFWEIIKLERNLADGMVTSASYVCTAMAENNVNNASDDIAFTLGASSDSDFINYTDLTKEVVLGWVTGSIDTGSIQTSLSSSLAISIATDKLKTVATGTPW
mgnify:FL=1